MGSRGYICNRCHEWHDDGEQGDCGCVIRDWVYGIGIAVFIVAPAVAVFLKMIGAVYPHD